MALATDIVVPEHHFRLWTVTLEGGDRRGRTVHADWLRVPQGRRLGEGAFPGRPQTREHHHHRPERVGPRSAAIGT